MSEMLYRAGNSETIWGYDVDLLVVAPEDVEAAMKDGWVKSPELTVKGSSSDDGKLSVDEAKAYLDDNGIDYDGLHWKKVVALATEHMAG